MGRVHRDALWRAFSGRRVYIPKQVRIDHPISIEVGQDAMRLLVEELGGVVLEVPIFPELGAKGRRDRVLALRRSGLPVPLIAAELGCTERRVYGIVAELRARGDLPPKLARKALP